jgi:LmbE family N-acetylglucosaminyl deacetylase
MTRAAHPEDEAMTHIGSLLPLMRQDAPVLVAILAVLVLGLML